MGKFIDLTGQRFGKLVVLNRVNNVGIHTAWRCQCDCGKPTDVTATSLRSGGTKSCGCNRTKHAVTHNMYKHPLYAVWKGIKQRCRNPNHPQYQNYGGRGITMHSTWFDSFPVFVTDVGEKPGPDLSIDRVNNDLGYQPGNVRWATRKEQNLNTRSNKRLEGKTYSQWAEEFKIHPKTFGSRIARGYSLTSALATPKPIEIEGKSIATWANESGISVKLLRKRIKAGWSIEKATSKPSQRPSDTILK